MTTNQVKFIKNVSDRLSHYSQFPVDVCKWISCQFALESNYGESRLALDHNNYCGMKNPMVRISAALHAGDSIFHWAQFSNLDTCIVDYLLCIQYHRPISTNYDTISHYSSFISKFYCPDKDYIDKINIIYSQFKSYQNEYTN